MNRTSRHVVTTALVAITSTAVTGLVLRQVGALGVPATPTMYYRGTLDGPAGTHTVRVALFDAATGGAMQCQSDAVSVPVGPLEVPLPDACTTAVHNGANLFAELTVDGTAIPGRSRLGAVPFAVEADRAVRATAAEGALETRLAALETRVTTLTTDNATLRAQLTTATDINRDCPRGYTLTADAEFTGDQRLCVRGSDQMVRVGVGNGAFWIDRYEASVWPNADGSGAQYGATGDDYPAGFPDNGQWTTAVYALSKPAVRPSVSMTWFQANEACRMGGKRLATGDEWLAAARGTPDNETNCWIATGNTASRATRAGTGCRSRWGAEDMIGNVWEWTSEWYAGIGNGTSSGFTNNPATPWPTGYNDDATWNINSYVDRGGSLVAAMPAAAIRGGYWSHGPQAGVFALNLRYGPSAWGTSIGFRCVART